MRNFYSWLIENEAQVLASPTTEHPGQNQKFNKQIKKQSLYQKPDPQMQPYPQPNKKPKVILWHGSREKIMGDLVPMPAHDVGGAASSNQKAVYATPNKNFAIMMGLAEKGAFTSVFHDQTPLQMVLFKGKLRRGQKAYLYKLSSETFEDTGSVQEWTSKVAVKPLGVEEVNVDDYLNLVRTPTKEDWKLYYKHNKG